MVATPSHRLVCSSSPSSSLPYILVVSEMRASGALCRDVLSLRMLFIFVLLFIIVIIFKVFI